MRRAARTGAIRREPAPRRDDRYAFRIGVLAVPLFRLLADWGYYSVAGADCATNTELHVRRRRSLSLSVVFFLNSSSSLTRDNIELHVCPQQSRSSRRAKRGDR